jgi:hypothetical protein
VNAAAVRPITRQPDLIVNIAIGFIVFLPGTFRGAKDSHMGVGFTGFNQAECVPSSVAPPIVAFCLLFGWQPLPTRGHLCRFKDHVSPYWCIRGVTPHSLIRRW